MITEKTIERVMVMLHERYERKGSDFIFKSRRVAKDLNTSPQIIGHILAQAVKRGYPIDYYTKAKTGVHVWKTTLEENENKDKSNIEKKERK